MRPNPYDPEDFDQPVGPDEPGGLFDQISARERRLFRQLDKQYKDYVLPIIERALIFILNASPTPADRGTIEELRDVLMGRTIPKLKSKEAITSAGLWRAYADEALAAEQKFEQLWKKSAAEKESKKYRDIASQLMRTPDDHPDKDLRKAGEILAQILTPADAFWNVSRDVKPPEMAQMISSIFEGSPLHRWRAFASASASVAISAVRERMKLEKETETEKLLEAQSAVQELERKKLDVLPKQIAALDKKFQKYMNRLGQLLENLYSAEFLFVKNARSAQEAERADDIQDVEFGGELHGKIQNGTIVVVVVANGTAQGGDLSFQNSRGAIEWPETVPDLPAYLRTFSAVGHARKRFDTATSEEEKEEIKRLGAGNIGYEPDVFFTVDGLPLEADVAASLLEKVSPDPVEDYTKVYWRQPGVLSYLIVGLLQKKVVDKTKELERKQRLDPNFAAEMRPPLSRDRIVDLPYPELTSQIKTQLQKRPSRAIAIPVGADGKARSKNPLEYGDSRTTSVVFNAQKGDLLLIGRRKYVVLEEASEGLYVADHPSSYRKRLHMGVPELEEDFAVVQAVNAKGLPVGPAIASGPVRSGHTRIAL